MEHFIQVDSKRETVRKLIYKAIHQLKIDIKGPLLSLFYKKQKQDKI